MRKFQKGDEVRILIDIISGWHIPKDSIGKVLEHYKEDEEVSYVEVDFHYKETAARLRDDDSQSYWDISCGPIIHEKHLELVRK